MNYELTLETDNKAFEITLDLDLSSCIDEVIVNGFTVERVKVYVNDGQCDYIIDNLYLTREFKKNYKRLIELALDNDESMNSQIIDFYEDCRTEFLINQQELNEYYGDY